MQNALDRCRKQLPPVLLIRPRVFVPVTKNCLPPIPTETVDNRPGQAPEDQAVRDAQREGDTVDPESEQGHLMKGAA